MKWDSAPFSHTKMKTVIFGNNDNPLLIHGLLFLCWYSINFSDFLAKVKDQHFFSFDMPFLLVCV